MLHNVQYDRKFILLIKKIETVKYVLLVKNGQL